MNKGLTLCLATAAILALAQPGAADTVTPDCRTLATRLIDLAIDAGSEIDPGARDKTIDQLIESLEREPETCSQFSGASDDVLRVMLLATGG